MLTQQVNAIPSEAPRIPEGCRVYAIGDIHGRLDLLNALLRRIDDDCAASPSASAVRVFIGDYIDRGPDSRGVIETLQALARRCPTVCLTGNHEIYALRFLDSPHSMINWLEFGGRETLRSYGVELGGSVKHQQAGEVAAAFAAAIGDHAKFLSLLPMTFILGDFLFVHAGVRPGVPLGRQAADDLVTIREPFLSFNGYFGKFVVHGHTPVLKPDIRANRINLDTGAYATSVLTCLVIEGSTMRFL